MKLKDEKRWDEYVKKNTDPYGECCVNVARRVMELLEERSEPLRHGYHPDLDTPHGLICKADNDIGAGGITGFMAGAVAAMVSECHERGEEFRKAMRKYIGKFETTTAQVKTAVEDDDLERAKRLITDVFEEYQSTLAEAQKDYLLNYQTNREKQYLSTMNNRKLFTEKEKEIMKKNGFMNEEGLIP